jgi:hypothetical protein
VKYLTFAALADAYAAGYPAGSVMHLGNDHAIVYFNGEIVFEMHPGNLLREALDLLGIPHEESVSKWTPPLS